MVSLDANSIVRATSGQTTARMGAMTSAILHLESKTYYTIDGSASVIWEQLQTPTLVADLEKFLLERFKVDRERCTRELHAFLTELAANGLLEFVGSNRA